MSGIALIKQRIAERQPHATRCRYMAGCRCLPCRAANSRYESSRLLARKNGDWNGIVSAGKARHHLRWLSRRGVGRRAVAAACSVSATTLHDIRVGRKRSIRKRTERRILSVTPEAYSGGARIPAARVWRRIKALLNEGFTRKEIAARLGSKAKAPALQLRRGFVTGKSAMKVERLYAQVMQ